jgi:hypothetical protein
MCIRRKTREKARPSLAFSPPFLSLIHILPICFDSAQVLYIEGVGLCTTIGPVKSFYFEDIQNDGIYID